MLADSAFNLANINNILKLFYFQFLNFLIFTILRLFSNSFFLNMYKHSIAALHLKS